MDRGKPRCSVVHVINRLDIGGTEMMLLKLLSHLRPSIIQGWMYHGNVAASIAATSARGVPPVLWNVRQCLYDMKLEKSGTWLVDGIQNLFE